MPVSDTVRTLEAMGNNVTPQIIADFAKQEWDAWRRALNAGRADEAAEHLAEFDSLCALFQATERRPR